MQLLPLNEQLIITGSRTEHNIRFWSRSELSLSACSIKKEKNADCFSHVFTDRCGQLPPAPGLKTKPFGFHFHFNCVHFPRSINWAAINLQAVSAGKKVEKLVRSLGKEHKSEQVPLAALSIKDVCENGHENCVIFSPKRREEEKQKEKDSIEIMQMTNKNRQRQLFRQICG